MQEELLLEHFNDLIKFVKTRAGKSYHWLSHSCTFAKMFFLKKFADVQNFLSAEDPSGSSEKQITVSEVEPLVKDFAGRWKVAIELMHKDVITSFSNFLCGMEILRAALTQLLLYYTRLTDCIKKSIGGSALNKDLVSIPSIMYEIRKYSRTF